MTRKQFLGVLSLGLASVAGLSGIIKRFTEASQVTSTDQTSAVSYGAWRPGSADTTTPSNKV